MIESTLPIALERAVYGLITTPVLHLALEHGIFECLLADGPLSSSAVAERIGADADTVERLLLVLTAFDVVRRDADGSFHVPAEITQFVDRDSPGYVGGFVNHMVMGTRRVRRSGGATLDARQAPRHRMQALGQVNICPPAALSGASPSRRARLARVDRALEKIADGTYGLSDMSGSRIPRERLEAVPDAVCTFEEESAYERQQSR